MQGFLLPLSILLLGLGAPDTPQTPRGPAPSISLEELLRGMDRASRLYLDTALRFTCDETISETMGQKHRVGHYQYIFVFDEKDGFKDYRMVAGKGERPEVDPARKGFRFLERGYFWVLIFHSSRQPLHRYEILGEEVVDGARAVVLKFEPIPPIKKGFNDWFGTARVDPTTYQILKVEAMQADQRTRWDEMREDLEAVAAGDKTRGGKLYTIENASTQFGFLKNGMRFPNRSEVTSTRYYVPKSGEAQSALMVNEEPTLQTFKNYKFYGVRTAQEVRTWLIGKKPPKQGAQSK